MSKELGEFVTKLRKQNHLKQEGLALYAGVSMKFISQLENGKSTLRLDKVNDVLRIFGYQLGPVEMENKYGHVGLDSSGDPSGNISTSAGD